MIVFESEVEIVATSVIADPSANPLCKGTAMIVNEMSRLVPVGTWAVTGTEIGVAARWIRESRRRTLWSPLRAEEVVRTAINRALLPCQDPLGGALTLVTAATASKTDVKVMSEITDVPVVAQDQPR